MAEARTNPPRHMTVAEFMDLESTGTIGKLELVDGQVRAMSPASPTHSLIQANLAYLLGRHVRKHRPTCRVGTEAPIVPRLHANDNVRAPDLAVICKPEPASKAFVDPILIVEVLSPGNKRETWESIRALATIPALQDILVVDSEDISVELFSRDASGHWPASGQTVTSGSVLLASLDFAMPLAEIYAGTQLVG